MPARSAAVVLASLVALVACGDGEAPDPGREGGVCVGGQCLDGLVCGEANVCVDSDGNADDTFGGGDPDAPDDPSAPTDAGDPTAEPGFTITGDDTGHPTYDPSGTGDATYDPSGTGDATYDPSDTGDPSDTLDDGGGDCMPPACPTYAAKMQGCFPGLDIDWYADCLYIYDVCDIGGFCVEGTPALISCANSMPCDAVADGACTRQSC